MTKHPLTYEIFRTLWVNLSDDFYGTEEDVYWASSVALARAAADWQLEQVMNAWEDAWKSDLEHGPVKAVIELATKYPKIFAFSEVLASMRPTQQEDN